MCKHRAQTVNETWTFAVFVFFSCLAFIHRVESAQRRSATFSNWTRLAPLSTMLRPICRSLSQMGNIALKIAFKRESRWFFSNKFTPRCLGVAFCMCTRCRSIVHFVVLTITNFLPPCNTDSCHKNTHLALFSPETQQPEEAPGCCKRVLPLLLLFKYIYICF